MIRLLIWPIFWEDLTLEINKLLHYLALDITLLLTWPDSWRDPSLDKTHLLRRSNSWNEQSLALPNSWHYSTLDITWLISQHDPSLDLTQVYIIIQMEMEMVQESASKWDHCSNFLQNSWHWLSFDQWYQICRSLKHFIKCPILNLFLTSMVTNKYLIFLVSDNRQFHRIRYPLLRRIQNHSQCKSLIKNKKKTTQKINL